LLLVALTGLDKNQTQEVRIGFAGLEMGWKGMSSSTLNFAGENFISLKITEKSISDLTSFSAHSIVIKDGLVLVL
jgi:hypothetical protein